MGEHIIWLCCCCIYPPEDQRVFAWGRADYGQLGLGENVVKQGYCKNPTEVTQAEGATQVYIMVDYISYDKEVENQTEFDTTEV